MLQKPTKRTVQAYINPKKPHVIFKGPYDYETAQKISERYRFIEFLTPEPKISLETKIVKMKGPTTFILNEDGELPLSEDKDIFIKTKFYGKVLSETENVTTKFGISPLIKTVVEKVDTLNLEEVFELIIQGFIRSLLGIGDPALRNFIVAEGHVVQIDVDCDKKTFDKDPVLSLFACNFGKENKAKIEKVFNPRKEELFQIFRDIMKKAQEADINYSNEFYNFWDEILSETFSEGFSELDEYPFFTLGQEQMSKDFKLCRNSAKYSFGAFVVAFLGLYNYGFYTSKKGFSITWVRTSIYTGLLEDCSIPFILKEGEKIVNLIENLAKSSTETPNYELASKTALEIYQLLATDKKTRELSFWIVAATQPGIEESDHHFAKTAKKLYEDNPGNISLTDLSKYISRKSWIYKIAQGVSKMIRRCLFLGAYLDLFTEESETFKSKVCASDIESWDDLFILSPDPIKPSLVYRQENTGIISLNDRNLSIPVAKSILQKAFRVGLPLKRSLYKNLFENPCEMIYKQLSFIIPKHYTDDKHTKQSDKSETSLKLSEKEAFLKFFKEGMRSSNSCDLYFDSKKELTLYYVANEVYFKMLDNNQKPTSKNLFVNE